MSVHPARSVGQSQSLPLLLGRVVLGTIPGPLLVLAGIFAGAATMVSFSGCAIAQTQNQNTEGAGLQVVYPPQNHVTTSDRIFFIGSGAPNQPVLVTPSTADGKGTAIEIHQSPMGNFAPSFPLAMGENQFLLRQGDRTLTQVVTRRSPLPAPNAQGWVETQIFPVGDLGRLPQEQLCYRAIGIANLTPSIQFSGPGELNIPLLSQGTAPLLPDNKAALVNQSDPTLNPAGASSGMRYAGCVTLPSQGGTTYGPGQLRQGGTAFGLGKLEVLDPDRLPVVEVTVPEGVARTGPSTNYSRLTPLPQGTQARVTGYDGEWLRLGYGGWIRERETRAIANRVLLPARLRSVTSRRPRSRPGSPNALQDSRATEIRFPLDRTVPISVNQGDRHLTLTLHHTIAETDIVAVPRDRAVDRVTWQQANPDTLQFRVQLRGAPWGYQLRYDNNTLVLRIKHPPQLGTAPNQPLRGTKILIDPGHGGKERGAIGPTGYPEKDANLVVSLALRSALESAGAEVVMTRDTDVFVSLGDRQAMIAATEPTLALSIHFNALPDSGNPETTAGVGMFWYYPQAQELSEQLQAALTQKLNRDNYGVFWNNLALTRPSAAPAVLLELGFMTHPEEFEWIQNPKTPGKLATVLTDVIITWVQQAAAP